jgi:hypothetical protein
MFTNHHTLHTVLVRCVAIQQPVLVVFIVILELVQTIALVAAFGSSRELDLIALISHRSTAISFVIPAPFTFRSPISSPQLMMTVASYLVHNVKSSKTHTTNGGPYIPSAGAEEQLITANKEVRRCRDRASHCVATSAV